jgi:hypothetical protein
MPATLRSNWPASVIALAGASVFVYWCRLAPPLWVDEEMIALNARWRSFAELAGPLWLDQSAPVGWLALERLALVTFGFDERAARAVPVLFGIGTLAVAWWIGRRWMSPPTAALLVALCAMGPWIVFFTLELKHYSSDVCWALLLPALAVWATEGTTSGSVVRRACVWWMAASAVAPFWVVAFGLHYLLAMRHALSNAYLANYWGFAFPAVSEGWRRH